MRNKIYFSNAFSLQMVSHPATVHTTPFPATQIQQEIIPAVNNGDIISCIGHLDTANVLNIPCNRVNIHLNSGDILFVAQLQGGRLQEGATKLPDGFTFEFLKVTIE